MYSPVVNDITFHVLLLMVLHFGHLAKIVDVETTFLYGDLEEKINMECPQKCPTTKNNCIILNKCIYGLVQAACQYYKKAVKVLKSFCWRQYFPMPLCQKEGKGYIVHVALYIDDNLMVGNIATINDAIEALKSKGLLLKIMEGLQDYLSCKIKFRNKKHAWLG